MHFGRRALWRATRRAMLPLAAGLAAATASPAAAQGPDAHVLIYSGTVAHRHADTIAQGIGPIQDALDAANISHDWEDCDGAGTGAGQCQNPDANPRIFTPANLAQYDAIFLFNAGGNTPAPLWNQAQRDAIQGFVNDGGGIAANHLATDMGAARRAGLVGRRRQQRPRHDNARPPGRSPDGDRARLRSQPPVDP